MNKYKFVLAFLTVSLATIAQESDKLDADKEATYNKWSVELNVGQNEPEKPYATGYFSSDPSKYFNFSGVQHVDLGVRYMFNTTFGAKIDFGYDIMKNQSGTTSLPFETQQYRVGIQGVVNLGRMLQFETFTQRFGLLFHGGLQVSQLTPQMGVNKDVTEDNGGLILGVTPQVRISNRIVLTGDFSYLGNVRQHFAWDGNYSDASNNLAGTLFNTSLGLTFYLGKNDKHADWTFKEEGWNNATDKMAQARLDNIETLMNDTDKDGAVIVSKEDALKTLIEKGYVNVFYDVNKDTPNSGSTNNVYHIINYLRQYPTANAVLIGYADVRGNEASNQDLSNRRAQKLYDVIIASGIDASRVTIKAEGVDTSYPNTKTGLDLARRVSVTLK